MEINEQTYEWLVEGLAATCVADTNHCAFEGCPFRIKEKKCMAITAQDWHEFFEEENKRER